MKETMEPKVVTEITKTYTEKDVRMKVVMEDGDIVKIMFHREVLADNHAGKKWMHMFSLNPDDLFSYRKVKETIYSLTQLCYKARDLLIGLGG